MQSNNRVTAVLDANVLFPYRKRDTLLRFFEAEIYQGRWSEQIHAEWMRSVLANMPHIEGSLLSQQRAILKHFPDAMVTGHEPLVHELDLPDPDDAHVLAAAIQCSANCIVTENISDFPSVELNKYNIEALSADEFLSRFFSSHRKQSLSVLKRMQKRYIRPAFSPSEFILDLSAKGLPKLAACASEHWAEP